MRGFWMIVVGLAFVALLSAGASADPWPSWNATQPWPYFGVNVSEIGGLTYYTLTVTPPANGWSFRAFVPYVGNLDGLADPPGSSGYGYAYSGPTLLPNDAGWTSLNGGWEWGKLGSSPSSHDDAAFGWMGGWTDLNGGWTGTFCANLGAGASNWDQTHFSLHVRQPDGVCTFWAGNGDAVPEPTSMVLLGSGLALLLGVGLRRRHGR